MVNEILSIFDEGLREKCWIDVYGRLVLTGKQAVGTAGRYDRNSYKRFPISMEVITTDACDLQPEFFKDLVPDDTKKAVAFWKTIAPVTYSKIPGISSVRKIKKAETTIQFVCWLNIRKASGVNVSTNWGTVVNGIVKDAIKTIECNTPINNTGVDGISNLRIEVIGIGDIESWRKAMSEYSIENIEAISVWPFAGFTLTCKVSFIVQNACLDAFVCSTEFDMTGFCPPEAHNPVVEGFARSMMITRTEGHEPIEDYPNYFPLSLLSDEFWNYFNGVIRVTDEAGQELPYQLISVDDEEKTGGLYFKADLVDEATKFYIHFDTELSAYAASDPYGSQNVWTAFQDAVLLNEDPAGGMFTNSVNGSVGTPFSNNGLFTGNWIEGPMEMKANQFFDANDNLISFGTNTFNKFAAPVTIIFAFNFIQLPSGTIHLFGNWNSSNSSQRPWRIAVLPTFLGEPQITIEYNTGNRRQTDPLNDVIAGQWNVAAIKYDVAGAEVDINSIARVVVPTILAYPTAANSATRTIGGLGAAGSETALSAIMVYNGALSKAQRDEFYFNWITPGGFWTV